MLTQTQIDFFHQNGYLIMRNLLKGRELAMLQEAVDEVQAMGVARVGTDHLYHTMPDGSKVYWRSEKMWQRGDIFQAVTVNPELLENIGQCVGGAFYPANDSLVVKLANSGAPVAFHQDPPYMAPGRDTTFAVPNFTTDLYLDHSGPDNGCVWAVPRRHLVGHVDFSGIPEDELYEKYGAVPLEMEAGDVLFHCLSTPHGSKPNTSDIQRRIFYIHYMSEEVYEHDYKSMWSGHKPGWSKDKQLQIERMLEMREKFGFDVPREGGTLNLGVGGFTFNGTPTTLSRYWAQLITRISETERKELQRLKPVLSGDSET